MNELQIEVKLTPGSLSTNFDEIKINVSEQMQIYKELEVTEENKADRKKDIAVLRKFLKAIAEKESEIRNLCLAPYNEFKKRSAEIIEIINEPIRIIDNQVKEFEDKQRLLKIAEIKKFYAEQIGELDDNISIDQIYDSKWENATTTMKFIRTDIEDKLNKIRQEVAVISSMQSDKQQDALNSYWMDLNLAKSISMINTYEENKRRILAQEEERKRREQEAALERERQRIREEERAKVREEERIREEERQKALAEETRIREEERLATEKRLMGIKEPTEPIDLEAPFETDESPFVTPEDIQVKAVFTVIGTPFELNQVEMYLNSIGLLFERKDD
jgi:hypothetical protein